VKLLTIAVLALAALLFAVVAPRGGADASSSGSFAAPLISCPNVDGSTEPPMPADPDLLGGVRVGDILKVVQAFFHDAPAGFPNAIDADYVFLYDRNANGQQRVDDILNVVQAFFTTCPKVDTQVAQATQWALQHPGLLTEADDTNDDLNELGYFLASGDVPGQGKHYVKGPWDGVFDPAAPEGLVYNDGLLAAQLYVVNGASVGWVEDIGPNQGPCWDGMDNGSDGTTDGADIDCGAWSPGGNSSDLDDTNIDPFCNPSLTYPNGCSWASDEGWHVHYRLCTVHIGTPQMSLTAIKPHPEDPFFDYESVCATFNQTGCSGSCGIYAYSPRTGWMGHLWNWVPNANLVPDANSTMNGRFADCFPDPTSPGGPWKSYNCPQ
jgi:hypothetical protein